MMRSYENFRKEREQERTTCVAEVKRFLAEIEQKRHLNAFITVVDAAELLRQAEEADRRFADGTARKLEGMVVAVKDNIATKGIRTTCASRILENFEPVYDATVVERLKAEGAIIIGKTNLDEFAMGSSNENSAFGAVKNPYNEDYVPGGSSGGSAVAVAAGMCHTALGSDTGGSVRQPAAFCGILGLKPTYGRISRYGLVAFASSLDQIGIFGSSLQDVAQVLDCISGHDPQDSTSAPYPPTTVFPVSEVMKPQRCAVLDEQTLQACSPEVRQRYLESIELLRADGVHCVPVQFPQQDVLIATYYIIATAEASSNLARYDGIRYGIRKEGEDIITATRTYGFGTEVKRRIMLGTFVLSSGYYEAYYRKALRARRFFAQWYDTVFEQADAFFLPTSPTPPFRLGERKEDPIAMYLSDLLTVSANLVAIPAMSIPFGMTQDNLPIGMQVQVGKFREKELFGFSRYFQEIVSRISA